MTWYVVFRGRQPGVYRDWQTCNQQVCGFSNCLFRGYQSREEAVADYISFFATGEMTAAPNQQPPTDHTSGSTGRWCTSSTWSNTLPWSSTRSGSRVQTWTGARPSSSRDWYASRGDHFSCHHYGSDWVHLELAEMLCSVAFAEDDLCLNNVGSNISRIACSGRAPWFVLVYSSVRWYFLPAM